MKREDKRRVAVVVSSAPADDRSPTSCILRVLVGHSRDAISQFKLNLGTNCHVDIVGARSWW